MNILYIDHYAGSPRHGMEYRPYYMARHWVQMGHHVTIVGASFSHLRYCAPEVSGETSDEIIDGIRYIWLKTPSYSGNGFRRAVNMLAFISKLFRIKGRLVNELAPDVVIASSTYTWDIFPAHAIAHAAGGRLVFEVHDLWPLSPMEVGGMSPWHPFIMSLQWAEDHACRHADLVVSMLPLAQEHLCQRGMAPAKFHYIPNGIELSEWDHEAPSLPQAHLELVNRCRAQGRFLVCFAGSHGLSNALDALLDAAKMLAEEPVDFVLVGQGLEKPMLQQKAAHYGLRNVHFLEPVHKDAIPTLLRSMDCLYIGAQYQPVFRFGISPNKLMDYMAAGKPVVCAYTAGNDIVGDAGCGISVKSEEPSEIAGAIMRLMRLPASERERMGEAGKAFVQTHHDNSVLAERFLRLIQTHEDAGTGVDPVSDPRAVTHYR